MTKNNVLKKINGVALMNVNMTEITPTKFIPIQKAIIRGLRRKIKNIKKRNLKINQKIILYEKRSNKQRKYFNYRKWNCWIK